MAGGEVGRLKIRVLPDTSRFRQDLKKALERIERTARVEVGLVLESGATARLRKQIEGIRADVTANVDVARQALERARGQVESIEADIDASVDAGELRRNVREAAESVREDVRVGVDLQRGTFAAQVAAMTRPRELPIVARLHVDGAMAAFGAMSGLNSMRRLTDEFLDTIRNLDQTMPRLARSATTLGTVLAGALAATSNLLGISSGLVGIVPILLPLPAVLAATAGAFTIVALAMADAGSYIGDLGAQWSALRADMSAAFWSTAEDGIRRFTAAFVPLAQQMLPEAARQIGSFAQSIAAAFEMPRGAANLEQFFGNFSTMMENMREGMQSMTSALLELVGAGSAYLPRLGAAFSDVMSRFNEWLVASVDSGRFFEWVDAAIVNFKALMGVIGGLSGILNAVAAAALAAGAATLTDFAAALDRVHQALDGPVWQGALTTVFEGAHQAMANLAPAASAMGDAFIALAPTLAELLGLIGEIANVALVALAGALQNPVFVDGLTSFFEGVKVGMEGFAPAVDLIAEKIGSILELAGVFAANFGPLLAGALEQFAPVIEAITSAMGALIPVLTEQLGSAIAFIAPLIVGVVTAISEWVQANPQLAATLLIAGAAIGGIIAVLVPVVSAIIGVVGAVTALTAAFGAAPIAIGAAVAAVVAILVGLVAAVAANWQAISTWWTEGWASMAQQTQDGMAAVVQWWNDGWASITQGFAEFWSGMLANAAAKGAELLAFLATIPGEIGGIFASAGTWLVDAGRNVVQGLLDGAGQLLPQVGQFFLDKLPGWMVGPFKSALGIHSPSRVFAGFGKNIGQGAINGIAAMAPAIRRATSGLASAAVAGFGAPSLVDRMGLEAEARRVQSAVERAAPGRRAMSLQVDSQVAVEEERRYHAEMLGEVFASKLEGMSVNVDGRRTIGALTQNRAWPKP